MTMVSAKTSKMPNMPCFTGFLVSAQAWAMLPVPRPASLEKMPRDTPFFRLRNTLPTTPPVKARGWKAPPTMAASTPGSRWKFSATTPSASATYSSAMKGTSFSATLPMRLMPPSSTRATSMATKTPTMRLSMGSAPSPAKPYCKRAASMEVTMVFTWVALPVPNTVSTPNRE